MITPNQIAELKGLVERFDRWLQNTGFDGGVNSPPMLVRKEFVALLAEIEALRAEGWQDIGTAPKDGETEVLTYRKMGLQSVAVWTGELGWCCTDGVHLLDVTHWRPLPPPPKGQSDA